MTDKSTTKLASALLVAALTTAVSRADVIVTDHGSAVPAIGANDTGNTTLGQRFGWDAGEGIQQTFTVASAGVIDSIYLAYNAFNDGETITLNLSVNGSPVAVGLVLNGDDFSGDSATDGPTSPVYWMRLDLSAENVAVNAGSNHFALTATADTGNGYAFAPCYANGTNPYSGGRLTGLDALSIPGSSDLGFVVTVLPGDPGPAPMGDPLLAVDFNCSDAFGSPSQSLFRVVSGSAAQSNNTSSYGKTFGAWQATISQPGAVNFEFRGANGDNSRAIPGGDTSLSYLVADFIATREGAIDIGISGLPAGDYVFRSFHLDTTTGNDLGFAQGTTPTTPNMIEASVDGVVRDSVEPTALGAVGLNTTFIADSQVPTLTFAFSHDGLGPANIELRSNQSNGSGNFLLLNGFAIFQAAP